MVTKTRKASDGPRWCWQCERQLQWAAGKGKGLFYYVLMRDKQAIPRRVHAGCVEAAKSDGLKVV